MRSPRLSLLFTAFFFAATLLATPVAAVDETMSTSTPTPAVTPAATALPTPSAGPESSATASPAPPGPAASPAPAAPSTEPAAETPGPVPAAPPGPTTAPPRPAPSVGATAEGESVVLPDGTVLPPLPAAQLPSIHAEMLREHGARVYRFEPGTRPVIDLPDAYAGPDERADTGTVVLAGWTPGDARPQDVDAALPNGLRREVQGFLPYWLLDSTNLQYLQYDKLSTIAYFGVPARADGYLDKSGSGWSGWTSTHMTNVINNAHARGVKVILTVTMMSWDGDTGMATLLGNSTYRARLVQEIVAAVKLRNADGVNIDFEPVYTGEREEFTSFVRQLKAGLVNGGARSYLSVCTMAGAATWATGYDVAGLVASGGANHLFVMGYDYSWAGSQRAGAVAPMDSSYQLDVRTSVEDHLRLVSGTKLIWGVPYYGRSWPTTSDALNAYTRPDTATSYTRAWYYTAGLDAARAYGRRWDPYGLVPWFATWDSANSTWREGYYDDAVSLGHKYDLINAKGLGGTGMWHLFMDGGRTELWDLLRTKFGDTTPPRVTGRAPAPGATNVSQLTKVRVSFSEPVTGVDTHTFVLIDTVTGKYITGSVTYDAGTRTATFVSRTQLLGNRTYKAGVTSRIRDLGGNALAWTAWSFTTAPDTTPPRVRQGLPAPGSVNVSTGTTVRATFSEPVIGVGTHSFVLIDTATGKYVAATVTYDKITLTATLKPSSALARGRTYKAGVTTRVTDLAGNRLSWTAWSFTTAP